MRGPLEINLNHPIEIDRVRRDKLTVASFNAIANFRTNSAEQVIRSMAQTFGVPRRVIRHLHPDDANRAGDMIVSMLDQAANSFR
ncbi:hypothetical protein [Afipia sp. DC4300-2b1]|uniref:hypothetical protein n=1 Tax=Afipia sp. DC4300-2b1 TaxID=2804672 RepID=UPI003CF52F9B